MTFRDRAGGRCRGRRGPGSRARRPEPTGSGTDAVTAGRRTRCGGVRRRRDVHPSRATCRRHRRRWWRADVYRGRTTGRRRLRSGRRHGGHRTACRDTRSRGRRRGHNGNRAGSRDDHNTTTSVPSPHMADTNADARVHNRLGSAVLITAYPRPAPCTARPTRSNSIVWASAHTRLPAANTLRPDQYARRAPGASGAGARSSQRPPRPPGTPSSPRRGTVSHAATL